MVFCKHRSMAKAVFISDLHLGAGYVGDARAHEQKVCRFLEQECAGAAELYLLGDILDYWYEYKTVVPRGHVRFFGALARLADAGVRIAWLTGNHDIWLFDYLRDELGIEVVDAPAIERDILGHRFLLAHGDRIGHATLGFRLICRLFRNKWCQRAYAALHPRLTVPFARAWSRSSRAGSQDMPAPGRAQLLSRVEADCRRVALTHRGTEYMVIGHHHMPHKAMLGDTGIELVMLGDWQRAGSYAVFDGMNLQLCSFV